MKGKTIIIKPVSTRCNSKCDYCYNRTTSFRTTKVRHNMEIETVEAIIRGLLNIGMDRIRLVWHGGEPLLRGLQFYKEVVQLEDRIRAENPELRLENGVQSNLTRLTPVWCEFFKANHFDIGTSLDGWRELHNAHRHYSNGVGTFDDTLRGLTLAKEYGILGGYIAVVTKETLEQDPVTYLDYLTSICPRVEVTPCWETEVDRAPAPYTVQPGEFLLFLQKMFDAWWKQDKPDRGVRIFHGFMQGILGGQEMTCSFRGNCEDFLALDADGSLYPCGKFSGVPEFYLGNILNEPLSKILENQVYTDFLAQRINLPAVCQSCKWVKVCNNGCTYERYQGNGQYNEVSLFCEVWKGMYEHVQNRIEILRTAQSVRNSR